MSGAQFLKSVPVAEFSQSQPSGGQMLCGNFNVVRMRPYCENVNHRIQFGNELLADFIAHSKVPLIYNQGGFCYVLFDDQRLMLVFS